MYYVIYIDNRDRPHLSGYVLSTTTIHHFGQDTEGKIRYLTLCFRLNIEYIEV